MSFPQLPGSRPNASPQKKPLAKKVEQSVKDTRGTKAIEGKVANLPVEMQPLPKLEKSFFASQDVQLISSTESQGPQKAKSTPAVAKTDKVVSTNSNALSEYRNELYSTAREIEAFYQKGELSKEDRDLLISTIIKTLQELAKAELDPYEAWGNHEKNISEENRKTFRFLTKSTRSLINETAKLAQSGELEEALKIFKNLEGMNSLKNDRDKYLGQGRDWGDLAGDFGNAFAVRLGETVNFMIENPETTAALIGLSLIPGVGPYISAGLLIVAAAKVGYETGSAIGQAVKGDWNAAANSLGGASADVAMMAALSRFRGAKGKPPLGLKAPVPKPPQTIPGIPPSTPSITIPKPNVPNTPGANPSAPSGIITRPYIPNRPAVEPSLNPGVITRPSPGFTPNTPNTPPRVTSPTSPGNFPLPNAPRTPANPPEPVISGNNNRPQQPGINSNRTPNRPNTHQEKPPTVGNNNGPNTPPPVSSQRQAALDAAKKLLGKKPRNPVDNEVIAIADLIEMGASVEKAGQVSLGGNGYAPLFKVEISGKTIFVSPDRGSGASILRNPTDTQAHNGAPFKVFSKSAREKKDATLIKRAKDANFLNRRPAIINKDGSVTFLD